MSLNNDSRINNFTTANHVSNGSHNETRSTQYSQSATLQDPNYTEYKESKHYFRHINAQRDPVDSQDYHDQEATYRLHHNNQQQQRNRESELEESFNRSRTQKETDYRGSPMSSLYKNGGKPASQSQSADLRIATIRMSNGGSIGGRERTVPIQIASSITSPLEDEKRGRFYSISNNLGLQNC